MKNLLSSKRFVVQLIFVFITFTLGSVILLGVPAAWLLERQTNAQLQALVDQSIQTTTALFDNQIIQLQNMATLLAERPTLNQLIIDEEYFPELFHYLTDFLNKADLDAIMICRDNLPIVEVGAQFDQSVCEFVGINEFHEISGETWLLSRAQLDMSTPGAPWVLVARKAVGILDAFSQQTDMSYLLFAGFDQLIYTTLQNSNISTATSKSLDQPYQKISIGETSYLTGPVEMGFLSEHRLIGLLDINPYLARTHQFRNFIILVFLGVGLFGGGVAVLVAQGISKPINQLAKSAVSIREGDLTTPLTTSSNVWELHQLSNALEDARVSLKYSLDQLRQEKLWIENLLNSMVECLLTIDDNLKITFISRSIEKIMGMDPTSLLGKHVDEVFVPTPGESLFSQQLPGQNQSLRITVMMNDQEILLSVSTSNVLPLESGNASRALMIRDVTDEERVHRLLGDFMANITHEFRTPLSALSASVELLMDDLPNLSKKEMAQLLGALNLGIVDLQALIDNLIEAASIEAGRFKLNPGNIELSKIIDCAINTVYPLMQKKKLRLEMSKSKPSFPVMADQRRTVQALINLMSNAIKHSPEGGTISLRTLMMEGEVLIEIQDEGQGVPPEYQDHIFKRFTSSKSDQNSSTVGMGLGLSVVKAVIEAQDGRVGFRNDEKGGAIFWCTLKIIPEELA